MNIKNKGMRLIEQNISLKKLLFILQCLLGYFTLLVLINKSFEGFSCKEIRLLHS